METSAAVNLVSGLQSGESTSLTCSDPQKKSLEKKGFV